MKYYLLGVLSAAVMLYGMSLIYGFTGLDAAHRHRRRHRGSVGSKPIVTLGIFFVLIGFAFKVSAVPFHFWAPDTYEGAPTPVTAFLSVASKAAGFVAIMELVFVGFYGRHDVWGPLFWILAALTMTVGQPHRAAPDQRRAHAGLLVDRPGRATCSCRFAVAGDNPNADAKRAHGDHRLPADLRGDEPRRVRRRHRRRPQDRIGASSAASAACSPTRRG